VRTIGCYAAVLLGLVSLSPKPSGEQAPAARDAEKKATVRGGAPAATQQLSKLVRILQNERIDVQKAQGQMSFREALALIEKQLKDKGIDLPILIRQDKIKEVNAAGADVFDVLVEFPTLPKQPTVGAVLQYLVRQQPEGLTLNVRADVVEVTTLQA